MSRHDEAHSTCLNILSDSPHSAVRIAELCTFARALGGEIDDLRAACAAGPWRFDVENAPRGEWVMTRDAGPFSEWRKGKRDGNVWTGSDYNPIDTPIAFAIPNPPQVTT